MKNKNYLRIFDDNAKLAKTLANEIIIQLQKNKKFVLGCPGGRSLTKTYYYLGRFSYLKNISLKNLIIVMMDEYVIKKNNHFKVVNPQSHFSCTRFSRQVIKKLLNYKKKSSDKLNDERILFPNVKKPSDFDNQISKLGGIDIFLLASGSSDGHVAFNNLYAKRNSKTHITKLSINTRKDNMKTFPLFKKISEVPKFGLTVGLNTISQHSKLAILVLAGKEKNLAYQKIFEKPKFRNDWPASIIYDCKKFKIYVDQKASQTQ